MDVYLTEVKVSEKSLKLQSHGKSTFVQVLIRVGLPFLDRGALVFLSLPPASCLSVKNPGGRCSGDRHIPQELVALLETLASVSKISGCDWGTQDQLKIHNCTKQLGSKTCGSSRCRQGNLEAHRFTTNF